MTEPTLEDVSNVLWARSTGPWPADPRTKILMAVICDLLMEVEAIRETLVRSAAGAEGKQLAYRDAYRAIGLLTHNSAGVRPGLDKLLALFYPSVHQLSERQSWRETLMLRRLGFSDAEIAEYKRDALNAEMFT